MAKGNFNPEEVHKIGILTKTDSTRTRAAINVFEDKAMLDIRQWYKKKGDTEFKPGKGMSFDVNNLRRLRKIITKAINTAEELDLID